MFNTPAGRQILALVLCLWLPLQAVAGQWNPCHLLDMATETSHAHQTGNQDTALQGCHDHTIASASTLIPADDQAADSSPCFHCLATCQLSSALLLPSEPEHRFTTANSDFGSYSLFFPTVNLDGLRRPPRLS